MKVINAGKVKKKKVPLPILIEMENGVTSPFSITQTCDDDDLGPKSKGVKAGSCEVGVTFAPTAAMKYKGTLMIIRQPRANVRKKRQARRHRQGAEEMT